MLDQNPDHHHVEEAKNYVKENTYVGPNGPREGWAKDIPGESAEANAKRMREFDKNYRIAKGQRKQGEK